MTLNTRHSTEDSSLKIKTDDIRGKLRENEQKSEKFDSETSKLQPVNLSETPRDTARVHQRVADSLQRF